MGFTRICMLRRGEGEMNAAVNAHDFSARTGRIACVSPVYPEVYAAPVAPAGLRWEDEDGDAFEGPVSRSVSQLASPTVVFLAARARAYRLTRAGEVLVSLTGRVSVDVRTTLGGTFYDFDSAAGVVRLSGEPGAAELFAAQEYNGFYGAAISLSVSAGRSARVYFGGQLMGANGFRFTVTGVRGENGADVGPIAVTAAYHGRVRGMHVVRSELGERFVPHSDNGLDFEVHFGPYEGDAETGRPLRPIGYQESFCEAGNVGTGSGWRAASLAELAAVQIEGESYQFRQQAFVVSRGNAQILEESPAYVTVVNGAEVTVAATTLTIDLGTDTDLTYLHTLAARTDIANGTYDIPLGPLDAGDRLLPNIFALPSDVRVDVASDRGSGARNAGLNLEPGDDDYRHPMAFVARHRLPQNYRGAGYFRSGSDSDGEGHVNGAVYVCVKRIEEGFGAREKLPLAGRIRVSKREINITPPFARILARNTVEILNRNERWEETVRNQLAPAALVNAPDNVGLETELLPDGKTRVEVVLLDEDEPPPQAVTVAVETIGDRTEFVVRQGDARTVSAGSGLVFNGTRLTQSGQEFTVPNVEGVFQCGNYIGQCGNFHNTNELYRDWYWRWQVGNISGQPNMNITATYMGRRRGLHFVRSQTNEYYAYYRSYQSIGRFGAVVTPAGGYIGGDSGGYIPDGVGGGHSGNFDMVGLDGWQEDFCKKGGTDWRMPTALEMAGLSTDEDEIVMHVPYVSGYRLWQEGERASLRPRGPEDIGAVVPPMMVHTYGYYPNISSNKTGNIEDTLPWIAPMFALNARIYADDEDPWPEPSSQARYGVPGVYVCVKEVEGYDEPRPSRAWFGGATRITVESDGTQIWNADIEKRIFPFGDGALTITAGAHRFGRLSQTLLLDETVDFNLADPPSGFTMNTRKIPDNPDGLYEIVINIPKPIPDDFSALTLEAKPEVGVRGKLVISVFSDIYFNEHRISGPNHENPRGTSSHFNIDVPFHQQMSYYGQTRGMQVLYTNHPAQPGETVSSRPFTTATGAVFTGLNGRIPPGTGETLCEAGNIGLPGVGWRLASLMDLIAVSHPFSEGNVVTVRRQNPSGYAGLLRDGEWVVSLPPRHPNDFSAFSNQSFGIVWAAAADLPANYLASGVAANPPGTPYANLTPATGGGVRTLEKVIARQNLKRFHNGPLGTLGGHMHVCVRDVDPDNPANLPLAGNAEAVGEIVEHGPFSEIVARITVSVVGRDIRWNPILRSTPVRAAFVGTPPGHFGLNARTLPGSLTEIRVVSSNPVNVSDTAALTVRASPTFGGHKDIVVRLAPDDGLYFGTNKLSGNGGFRINVAGSHSSDTNVDARLTVSATYRGEIRGMHVVYSDLGAARTGRGSRTGYSYHSGPSGADGHRDGYQENFCADGNTGFGFGWRTASLAELAAVQLSASVVTLRDAAGAPDDKNNIGAGDYVLRLGDVGEGDAALLPNIHSGPSDLFLNAAYTTGTRSGVINYNASGVGFRPSNGVVPFQLQADERNGAFLRNNTIEDFVYVCVKDVAGGVRPDLPLAGNAAVGAPVTVASPLSRVLAVATVSVTGRDRNWNSVLRDEGVSVSVVGVGGDYLGAETTRLPNGMRAVGIVATGTIAAAEAAATVFASVRPRLGGAATLEFRFDGADWREELSELGAEAARLAAERARASRTEFDGEVLVLGDSLTRDVVFAESLLRMSIQYRGRRRGLYFATAEPESELPNWHQARDDVCAAGE